MRRLILTPFILALTAAPALAEIHPRYHQEAKAAAANVVIMTIEAVDDHGLTDMGDCTLTGRVEAVERGSLLQPGAPLTVTVPCYRQNARLPVGATQWQSREALQAERLGRVWLDETGAQIPRRYFQLQP